MFNSMAAAPTGTFGLNPSIQLRVNLNTIFSKSLSRGKWNMLLQKLFGKNSSLQSLAQVKSATKPVQKQARKVVNVPITKIVGSEGRASDFDSEFRPLVKHTQDRWVGIAIAQHRGIPLPPVELIQVGDEYFVRDGHHRISVARTFGQATIEAEILYELG